MNYDQQDADKEILSTLRQHGDNMFKVRPVLHYSLFDDKKSLQVFLDKLKSLSIQAIPTKKPLGARITMSSDMVEKNIFSQIKTVFELVVSSGGKYDGWETEIAN